MYSRLRRCCLRPTDWKASTYGRAEPSRMGSSRLSISTMTLSTPKPMSAESRCSVVEISTEPRMSEVA